jgi:hypothetical protein
MTPYSTLITLCTTCYKINKTALYPQNLFMAPVWFTEWRAVISLNTINQFVSIIQTGECVSEWASEYFQVESKILNFSIALK